MVAIDLVTRNDKAAGRAMNLRGGNDAILAVGIATLVIALVMYVASDFVVGALDQCGLSCLALLFAGGGSAVASPRCDGCCGCCSNTCNKSSPTSPARTEQSRADFEAQKE